MNEVLNFCRKSIEIFFRTAASVTPRVRWTARRARATARSGATSNSP